MIVMGALKMKVNGSIVESSAGFVKVNGVWKEIADIYGKVNGEWIKMSFLPYDSKIEYIETTGTQWINTLYKPNQDTRIVCEMQHTANTLYSRLFACASGTEWNSTPVFQVNYETNVTGNLRYIIGNETSWNILSSVTGDYNRHTYDFSTTKFLRDGVQVATHSAVTFQCTTEMAIFACMRTDGIQAGNSAMIGRLYSFKIYEGDTLVRDFIPVRVGTVGYLYDSVTKSLFGNAGSVDFVIGSDV